MLPHPGHLPARPALPADRHLSPVTGQHPPYSGSRSGTGPLIPAPPSPLPAAPPPAPCCRLPAGTTGIAEALAWALPEPCRKKPVPVTGILARPATTTAMPAARATGPAAPRRCRDHQAHRPGHHRPDPVSPTSTAPRYDLLAAALDVTEERLRGILARWRHAGWAAHRRAGQRARLVLADPGRDAAARPALRAREPSVTRLAHIRAVLAVRLWLQSGQAYQEGRAWWRSERRIRAAAGGRVGIAHVPDAEVHWPSLDGAPYAGQIWAIEAELTPKPLARTTGIMRAHADPHQRLRPRAARQPRTPATPRSSTWPPRPRSPSSPGRSGRSPSRCSTGWSPGTCPRVPLR